MNSTPLHGWRVVITRAENEGANGAERLRALGAVPLLHPAIAFAPPADLAPFMQALGRLSGYDWLMFTSATAVTATVEQMVVQGIAPAALAHTKIGVVGPATAAALARYGLHPQIAPERFRAEALLEALGPMHGQRVLLPCADLARDTLADGLRERGAEVERITAYRTVPGPGGAALAPLLRSGQIDAITFTSPSTIDFLLEGLASAGTSQHEAIQALNRTTIIVIGPTTARAASDKGLRAHTASVSTVDGMLDTLQQVATARPPAEKEKPMARIIRPRRLRRTETLRAMVRETTLDARDLIAPLFIAQGQGITRPISSMPGHAQLSVDMLDAEIDSIRELGIPSVLLFGIPVHKDASGSGAWDDNGPVPSAIRAIKQRAPDMVVVADVCLCEYTNHGHCGLLAEDPGSGEVLNDETLELLARAAVAYARAGADIVAPSAMMDGQVAAIRAGLDEAGFSTTPIMAYAAKFASAFYGPFREAAESTPQFGDRRAYQMDPANGREALREVELDVAEGADMLMVKPAGAYLDIIREVRQRFDLPLAAYQVSGEFAMIKAAAQNGWIDERRAALESLIAIKRAGADMIITYYAKEVVRWLEQ